MAILYEYCISNAANIHCISDLWTNPRYTNLWTQNSLLINSTYFTPGGRIYFYFRQRSTHTKRTYSERRGHIFRILEKIFFTFSIWYFQGFRRDKSGPSRALYNFARLTYNMLGSECYQAPWALSVVAKDLSLDLSPSLCFYAGTFAIIADGNSIEIVVCRHFCSLSCDFINQCLMYF